jgi:hypothetical protein
MLGMSKLRAIAGGKLPVKDKDDQAPLRRPKCIASTPLQIRLQTPGWSSY